MPITKIQTTLHNIWCLFKESALEFMDKNTFQKGAALAYYTVFALPPIVFIVITIAGAVLGPKAVSGEVYYQLKDLLGSKAAFQVQEMVENSAQAVDFTLNALIGGGALLIAATGVFISMQNSLNEIWGVKPKPRREYLKLLRDRLLSFTMILSVTFMLLVSLVINAMLVALGDFITQNLNLSLVNLIYILNYLISIFVISLLFAAIYKYLPDVQIEWKDVWIGSLVTAVMFSLGKTAISFYLGNSDFASVYGATGSIIIILIWSFYTSQILFFGAIFTLVFSRKFGSNIYPSDYAVRVVRQEVEIGKSKLNVPGAHEHEVWDEEEEQSTKGPISSGPDKRYKPRKK